MKNKKIKILLAYSISLLPTNLLRVFFYRSIFKYDIYKSHIGWKTVILVDNAEFQECVIGRNNMFIGPMQIIINKNANIGKNNKFNCGWWAKEKQFRSANYKLHLHIGKHTHITSNHYFDVVGKFFLDDNSWIAGTGSQFWTHGAGVTDRDITIGKDCYIGSAVRFSPGSSIANNTIVGLGSIVTKKFTEDNVVIVGQAAKIVKRNYDWKTKRQSIMSPEKQTGTD